MQFADVACALKTQTAIERSGISLLRQRPRCPAPCVPWGCGTSRRQMDIGEVQAGVRVAADDHCFSPAAHGAAQGVAMGFGGIVFRAFGVARCKIGHGKTAVIGFAVETAVNFMVRRWPVAVGVIVVVTSIPGKGDHCAVTAPASISHVLLTLRTNTLSSMTKASILSGAAD